MNENIGPLYALSGSLLVRGGKRGISIGENKQQHEVTMIDGVHLERFGIQN